MEPRRHRYSRVQRQHRGSTEHWLRHGAAGALAFCLAGCLAGHTAEVQRSKLPPLPDPITRHQNRVVIQLSPESVPESQCVAYEQYQTLCFDGVRTAIEDSLKSLLWPSFPDVKIRRHGEELETGDYLLQVELRLDALPPDRSRYGWSAAAKGRWRVVRDGLPLEGESLSTRSRGDFAYGSGLGEAAGEVVDAVAAHIAGVVVRLPESAPFEPVRLPPVVLKNSFKPAPPAAPKVEPGVPLPLSPEAERQAKTRNATP